MADDSKQPVRPLPGEDAEITPRELCRTCNLETEVLIEWVSEGVVTPHGERVEEWHFGTRQFRRARTAYRLQRDLGVDTVSLPLVLDLLDEVKSLRRQLRILERQLLE